MNREQTRRGGATAPTPGRASSPLPTAGSRGRRGGGIVKYINETRSELRKVAWPSRQETVNLTSVVVILMVAVGAFLGAVDFLFQEFFRLLLGLGGSTI
jgi:preprotein translocase subunit SecE